MVGVSADTAAAQVRFIEKFGLTFPMVADSERAIINAWGVQKVLGLVAERSTFLIDPQGRVAEVWRKVKVEGHAEAVLAALRQNSAQ